MNFIQVPPNGWLCHELPDALIQRAVEQEIRTRALGAPLLSDGDLRRTAGASKLTCTSGPVAGASLSVIFLRLPTKMNEAAN
jgi:hypothetical protein